MKQETISKEALMARIYALPQLGALLFDLDGTLYQCDEYLRDGEEGEIRAVAEARGTTVEEAKNWFRGFREELAAKMNRKVGRGESILAAGYSQEWWNHIRNHCYDPEKFLRPYPVLEERLAELAKYYPIAVVSNSPTQLVCRVLMHLGLGALLPKLTIIGGNDAKPKPDQDAFRKAAELMKVSPEACLSIGDRAEYDALPAVRMGMGAVIVEGMQDLCEFLDNLIEAVGNAQEIRCFDLGMLLQRWYLSGSIMLAGITGQAGSGKTTTSYLLEALAREKELSLQVLPLDAFFILSSEDRKAWLEDGKRKGAAEYARRSDQISWWNFNKLTSCLKSLAESSPLVLRGVYNRADKGRLTLNMEIIPARKETIVVLEGVAIAHIKPFLGDLVYMHAPREVRLNRLRMRDPHRVGPEADERFALTESFERKYFGEHMERANLFVDNGRAVPHLMERPPSMAEL